MITDFMPIDVLIAFIVTCTIIELTPGPNMGYLAIVSLGNGRKAGLAVTIGIALGLMIVGIASAMGVATIISNSPFLYQTLRIGGVLYLLWLAWDGWKSSAETSASVVQNSDEDNFKFFKRGLITNLLNPKAALFYVAILPTFITANAHLTAQAITLSMIYVCIATIIHLTIVILANGARRFLDNEKKQQIIRRILSALLAGIALWFAWSTRMH